MASAGGLGGDHELAAGHPSAYSMPGCRLRAAGSSGRESTRAKPACASQKAVGPAEPEAAKQQGGCPVPRCHSFQGRLATCSVLPLLGPLAVHVVHWTRCVQCTHVLWAICTALTLQGLPA